MAQQQELKAETNIDRALDRSRRDREAAAALQAAIEEQLVRAERRSWPHSDARRRQTL